MDVNRTIFLGFIKLHILHHAKEAGVFGQEMIRELGRHGYELSPGTLYPVLHRMQQEKLLSMKKKKVGGRIRKYYHITALGEKCLRQGQERARELMAEIGN